MIANEMDRALAMMALAVALGACGMQKSLGEIGDTDMDSDNAGTLGNDSVASSITGPNGNDDADDDGTGDTGPAVLPSSNAVDILIVIDDSGSMAPAQVNVADAMVSLVEQLDAAGADWRIGVTTTNNGNPWCPGTSPESGRLVATSCRKRTNDFVFMGNTLVDAKQEACLDPCPEEWSEITLTSPPSSPGDEPRPWLERFGGQTNLPDGLSVEQAVRCIVPQGINGCGFEQPLESMYQALQRSVTPGEKSYGFMRDEAVLAILIVTDEEDCSHNPDHETIFLPEGNRTFWVDKDEGSPTSALCWNAGVQCSGGPGTYDDCFAVDRDVDANLVAAANAHSDAVIHPVSRYAVFLQSIEAIKKQTNPAAEVVVAAVVGVDATGQSVYADTTDAQYQKDFGIGPGCESDATRALPPVRIRELAEGFSLGSPNLYSICQPDYAPMFTAFGEQIISLLP